ncbi:hypothetical protein NC652_030427 [Populus alba x Populus x berolinensis]|nr:hypothetical protein NC652_030427 [Populus alba x Populus x berolinensis]
MVSLSSFSLVDALKFLHPSHHLYPHKSRKSLPQKLILRNILKRKHGPSLSNQEPGEAHGGTFETIHVQDASGHEFATPLLGNVFTYRKGHQEPWNSLAQGQRVY